MVHAKRHIKIKNNIIDGMGTCLLLTITKTISQGNKNWARWSWKTTSRSRQLGLSGISKCNREPDEMEGLS